MNLSHGRPTVAIPGPSIAPQRVLEAFARPLPDLYEGPFVEASNEVRAQLPSIARTEGHAFVVTGNGHAAWQMATSNTLARGDKVLALQSGRFAEAWGRYTAVSDVDSELMPGDDRLPVDPAALEDRLRQDTAHKIKAVLAVHVDTATSVKNDIVAMRRALDDAGHPALLMIDCIASMGCDEFLMDEWGVDIAVAGCQKGLMVPPGISFVWAGPKAIAAHETANMRVGYFDWDERLSTVSMYQYYAGTPPMAHMFALREALAMIAEEGGLDAVWKRHEVLADGVRAAVEAWAAPGAIEFQITSPEHRANCVTTIRTGTIDATELRRRCLDDAGLTLGLGIGGLAAFRIGHMGHLNPPMLLGTLGTIESALHSLDAPMGGSGVAAAARIIGKAIG